MDFAHLEIVGWHTGDTHHNWAVLILDNEFFSDRKNKTLLGLMDSEEIFLFIYLVSVDQFQLISSQSS